MGIINYTATKVAKVQGHSMRLFDRMPTSVKQKVAHQLGYPYDYPELDPSIKVMHVLQKKVGLDQLVTKNLKKSRRQFNRLMCAINSQPTSIEHVENLKLELDCGAISARLYRDSNADELRPLIVFYHGGGFSLGNIETHDESCRLLAKHAKANVLSIDYLLSPEATPEAQVASCIEAFKWAKQNKARLNATDAMAVGGDSAGGNLSAVVSQQLQNTANAPVAQLLIYPTIGDQSHHSTQFAEGLVLSLADADIFSYYHTKIHDFDEKNPIVTPMYGELKQVAPAFIICAQYDILYNHSIAYQQKLTQAGIKTELHEVKDQSHGFINITSINKAAKQHWIQLSSQFGQFLKDQS